MFFILNFMFFTSMVWMGYLDENNSLLNDVVTVNSKQLIINSKQLIINSKQLIINSKQFC